MNRSLRTIPFFLLFLLTLYSYGYNAEVYYLGGAEQSVDGKVINKKFSFQKRVKDLFNFSDYGKYGPDRSGRITGNIVHEINWNDVDGNRDKSFYKDGEYYSTDLNMSIQQKLGEDYNFENIISFRKTDDIRIEENDKLKIKNFNAMVYNPQNMIQYGHFYGEFSQFVLGSSMEGMNAEVKIGTGTIVNMIAARKNQADYAMSIYQRNVIGGMVTHTYNKNKKPILKLGIQAAAVRDDGGSLDYTSTAQELNNTVASIAGEYTANKNLIINFEAAKSEHRFDDNDLTEIRKTGTAFRIQPAYRIKKTSVRYLYYYVTPTFYTDSGSAMADKVQHQISLDYIMSKKLTLSLLKNHYWDHLDNSARTMRTTNDENYITAYIKPLSRRESFNVRTYANYLGRDSDDTTNSLESQTDTYGISINDIVYCIWDRVNITSTANMTWTVIGYEVNITYTAVYEFNISES